MNFAVVQNNTVADATLIGAKAKLFMKDIDNNCIKDK